MKERLKRILLARSVITGRTFTLASGKTSDFYCDARLTTLDPEGCTLCGGLFLEMLRNYEVQAVGGYSIGADPIVSSIAVLSFQQGRPLPAFIIRKQEKTHGTGRLIEGNFPDGGRVALFEDVVTSGGSILKGVEAVAARQGTVAVIMALLDRQEGGREAIEAAGIEFRSIFTREELLKP